MKTNTEKQIAETQKKLDSLKAKLAREAEKSKPKTNHESITTLSGIFKFLKCDPKKDVLKIDKFTKEETAVVEAVVERVRICKVYNDGKLPAKTERWYPWFTRSSAGAGLVFNFSYCIDDSAGLYSAARLSFLDRARSDAYAKNFIKTEEKAIQL